MESGLHQARLGWEPGLAKSAKLGALGQGEGQSLSSYWSCFCPSPVATLPGTKCHTAIMGRASQLSMGEGHHPTQPDLESGLHQPRLGWEQGLAKSARLRAGLWQNQPGISQGAGQGLPSSFCFFPRPCALLASDRIEHTCQPNMGTHQP